MNPIQAATAAARAAARQVRGESGTYSRGASSLAVTVIRGATSWDTSAPYPGVRVGDRSIDFLIPVSQLVLSGVQWEPSRNDEIDVNGVTYKVCPNGDSQQLWQYHDRDRTIFRIHCKERV